MFSDLFFRLRSLFRHNRVEEEMNELQEAIKNKDAKEVEDEFEPGARRSVEPSAPYESEIEGDTGTGEEGKTGKGTTVDI